MLQAGTVIVFASVIPATANAVCFQFLSSVPHKIVPLAWIYLGMNMCIAPVHLHLLAYRSNTLAAGEKVRVDS